MVDGDLSTFGHAAEQCTVALSPLLNEQISIHDTVVKFNEIGPYGIGTMR
jgi:hypothetical protein